MTNPLLTIVKLVLKSSVRGMSTSELMEVDAALIAIALAPDDEADDYLQPLTDEDAQEFVEGLKGITDAELQRRTSPQPF